MEAAFISFLINKLGGIAVDQAQSTCSQLLLPYTAPPLDQIHARVGRITTELKMMQTFLKDSNWSTAVAANKTLEAWIEQVREVAFKIEDIIDEYFYLLGRQRGRTGKNSCLMAPSDFCCSLAKAWRGIDSRLEETENEFFNLLNMRVGFGLTISGNEDRTKNSERDTLHYRAYSPMIIGEDDVVGIEENKSKLLSWLTNADACRKMTAIAVWGMGGQGKTTLVSNVYRHNAAKSHFDCQVDLWKDTSHAFIDTDNGSRVVVTTRKHEVARIANEEHIIELQGLNEKDAWILFCKKAFRRENNNDCPQKLEDYARRILNKCQGSPLAIVTIGSVLSFKENSATEWKKVHDCLHWEFENNPSLDEVKSILNLSFDDLPYYLKNCFVYCSIFPEDYLIKRKKLIRLWVAEGFVEARSRNRVMEEEAEDYLAQLVDRSMLQLVKRNEFGRPDAFRMHDVVREVS